MSGEIKTMAWLMGSVNQVRGPISRQGPRTWVHAVLLARPRMWRCNRRHLSNSKYVQLAASESSGWGYHEARTRNRSAARPGEIGYPEPASDPHMAGGRLAGWLAGYSKLVSRQSQA